MQTSWRKRTILCDNTHMSPLEKTLKKPLQLRSILKPALRASTNGALLCLAPIFATAFATQTTHTALVVGFAAAVATGIVTTWRHIEEGMRHSSTDHVYVRSACIGLATALGGSISALPFLIQAFSTALYVAYGLMLLQLLITSYIHYRVFGMGARAALSAYSLIILLVFLSGLFIGSM